MRVEVAYATADRQVIIEVDLEENMTAEQAIRASEITKCFPEIDFTKTTIGVFGHVCGLDQRLRHGDRVEIYRPLITDPISARRARAQKR